MLLINLLGISRGPGQPWYIAEASRILSPGQTDSQVDASWKLGSTCDSVWPDLVCTCVDLRWLAHILVEIKFARKSRQDFHRLATQPKSTHVCLEMGFFRLACTCEETCQCVWPPNASLYASSTCARLRLLAGPFDQGLRVRSFL